MEIRHQFCVAHPNVTEGKMMSSPAIHYNGKVFAFFSKNKKMVFKLGKDFFPKDSEITLSEFNPFKTKKPLKGWYEVDFEQHEKWPDLTSLALESNKTNHK